MSVEVRRIEYAEEVKSAGSGRYDIPIPGEIGEAFEDAARVDVALETEETESGPVAYLKISPADKFWEGYEVQKVKGAHPYRVRIPQPLHEKQQEIDGISNPFYGIQNGDAIRGQFESVNQELRVYRPDGFIRRNGGRDIRTVAFLVSELVASGREVEWVDLAADTEYDGQKFEIIPFDGRHNVFVQNGVKEGEESHVGGNPAVLDRVKSTGEIPTTAVRELVIDWYPEPGEEEERLYVGSATQQANVILPRKGVFSVLTVLQGDGPAPETCGWTQFAYSDEGAEAFLEQKDVSPGSHFTPIDDAWVGQYVEKDEDKITVYVPTPVRYEWRDGRLLWAAARNTL